MKRVTIPGDFSIPIGRENGDRSLQTPILQFRNYLCYVILKFQNQFGPTLVPLHCRTDLLVGKALITLSRTGW